MLINRVYKPKKADILYHYCDANAFHAICSNKKMRFSDLFSMNDFLEIHWGYEIWEFAAGELIKKVGKEFLDEIDQIISSTGMYGLLTASCFSFDGDVLSQWRAYADDGKGFVIGFKATDLLKLPVRPLKVLYDKRKQIEEIKQVITLLHARESGKKSEPSNFAKINFKQICLLLSSDFAAYKNPAFEEEKEVRLVHMLDFKKSNNFLKLTDAGGQAFGIESEGMPIQFRMRENVPVAFIEQDFTNDGKINPIKEVIIGPKNNVLPTAVLVFLETLGIGSVTVKRSKASYR